MINKRLTRIDSLSSLQWWAGFDREDLNRKAPIKQQRNQQDSLCWPYYNA